MSADALRRHRIFAALDDAELALVAALLEPRKLGGEECAWEEGAPSDGLWLLEGGTLRLETRAGGTIGRRRAPDHFGAAGLACDVLREASAFAQGEVDARVLSKTAFARLLDSAPHTAARVLTGVVAELTGLLREALTFANTQR